MGNFHGGRLSILILLMLFGCTAVPAAQTAATETSPRFSAQALETLNSLEKVDNHPFYVMRYSGGYERSAAADSQPLPGVACSLFAALGDDGALLYGRNFDWSPSTALLLFTAPPDGYASISMVNPEFIGITPGKDLLRLTDAERDLLLQAPFVPTDGMNAAGLVIAMAAVEGGAAEFLPSRSTIGSLGIIREVLDHTATVDEAVDLFSTYNINFTGGPPVHYLISDAHGDAVLIEYLDGQMRVMPNENAWHMATNHFLANGVKDLGNSGWRYDTMSEKLTAAGGILTPEEAMQLLSDVSQPASTQWSVVYNASTGAVDVSLGADYAAVHSYLLELDGLSIKN